MTTAHQQHTRSARGQVAPFYPPPVGSIDLPWTITVYNAKYEQERWRCHNEAANRSYAARELQAVGSARTVDVERYPTYFAEVTLNNTNRFTEPIGGIRIHTSGQCGDLPLLEELQGYTNTKTLQLLIDKLRPQDVSHGAGFWTNPLQTCSGLANDLAYAIYAMFAASQNRWYVGATHQYILNAWRSLGWHPAPGIPTFPYPDDRYQSCVLLGDRLTWPDDLTQWASAQVKDVTLDGSGARFIVRPMRLQEADRL